MEQQVIKSQHYVPVFYLNNFIDSSGKVHVYDRAQHKIFSCLPKNICQSNFLYETPWKEAKADVGKFVLCNRIEKTFSEYEGRYADLVKKLLRICVPSQNPNALICSHENKKDLISLIVNLFVRNPWAMDYFQMDTVPEEIYSHPNANWAREVLEELNLGGADSVIIHSVKKAYLLEHEEGGLVHEIECKLQKLNFTFYLSFSGKFITSSNPSCFCSSDSGQAFAYLPLSPNVAVYFGKDCVPRSVNNRITKVNADKAMEINSIYSAYDTQRVRYIISNSETSLHEFLSWQD